MMDEGSKLVGIIGDEDTVTGFVLAGCGERTNERSNFLVVTNDTPVTHIEEAFYQLTHRRDIAIILINQHVANLIRSQIREYDRIIPTVLEIPSKDIQYDPEKDTVMQRVNLLLGVQT